MIIHLAMQRARSTMILQKAIKHECRGQNSLNNMVIINNIGQHVIMAIWH